MMKRLKDPTYLGDGVYASFDGYHVWLHREYYIKVTRADLRETTQGKHDIVIKMVSLYERGAEGDIFIKHLRLAPRMVELLKAIRIPVELKG